ncbi:MAG TPA: hypothetical protein VNM37_18825, partial [Candidatus Dormibacteraeota bacterium]|nr:hypothetical protein [Candidatus Dormibacteraeota bacterium]
MDSCRRKWWGGTTPGLAGGLICGGLICFGLAWSMQAGVRDLRHAMEQKSKERQAWNLRRPPPKHRWHSPNALESPENLGPPEPGGTGFGY